MPPKKRQDALDITVQFRISREDAARLQRVLAHDHLKRSTWVRRLVLQTLDAMEVKTRAVAERRRE